VDLASSEAEFSDLMDFMNALTDPNSVDIRNTVPRTVPSGLSFVDSGLISDFAGPLWAGFFL